MHLVANCPRKPKTINSIETANAISQNALPLLDKNDKQAIIKQIIISKTPTLIPEINPVRNPGELKLPMGVFNKPIIIKIENDK